MKNEREKFVVSLISLFVLALLTCIIWIYNKHSDYENLDNSVFLIFAGSISIIAGIIAIIVQFTSKANINTIAVYNIIGVVNIYVSVIGNKMCDQMLLFLLPLIIGIIILGDLYNLRNA